MTPLAKVNSSKTRGIHHMQCISLNLTVSQCTIGVTQSELKSKRDNLNCRIAVKKVGALRLVCS